VLFVLYVGGAIYMFKKLKWSITDLFIVIMCSVLPFGPFYVERKYL
jgi:integral membrane protein